MDDPLSDGLPLPVGNTERGVLDVSTTEGLFYLNRKVDLGKSLLRPSVRPSFFRYLCVYVRLCMFI